MPTTQPLLFKNKPLQRPDKPRHFMFIHSLPYPTIATAGMCQLAYSPAAMRVQVVWHVVYASDRHGIF